MLKQKRNSFSCLSFVSRQRCRAAPFTRAHTRRSLVSITPMPLGKTFFFYCSICGALIPFITTLNWCIFERISRARLRLLLKSIRFKFIKIHLNEGPMHCVPFRLSDTATEKIARPNELVHNFFCAQPKQWVANAVVRELRNLNLSIR